MKMSSPSVQPRKKYRGNKNTVPMANCVRVARYPTNPGPCVVLSPVLVPYVQAPVQYVKCKPKKGSEKTSLSPAKVRYVPAYTYTTIQPRYVYYNRKCVAQIPVASIGAPYAMPINRDIATFNQRYVSALAPPSTYVETTDHITVRNSDLNPLSRPYTPPNRMVKCTCGQNEDAENVTCPKHPKSSCSTPDIFCDDSMSDVTSRAETPDPRTCPYCRGKSSSFSDNDSGVEGESDDEGWCTCLKDSYSQAASDSATSSEDEEEYPDLLPDLCKEDQGELSQASSDLVNFFCDNLGSHEWRTVARELGVSDVIIQSVEYDVYDNFREEMRFVFSFWVRSQASQSHEDACRATEKALAEIGRKDLIGKLSTPEDVVEEGNA